MVDESLILDAIAAIGLDVAGINDDAIYSLGGGQFAGVKDLPDDIAEGAFPALVVFDGGFDEIQNASWERTHWDIEAGIWVEYSPRGEAIRGLLNLREPFLAALRAKAKAGLAATAPEVSSSLPLSTGAIEARQWRRIENAPWYLVLPVRVRVTLSRAVTYVPA